MNHGDSKIPIKHQEKEKMLDELESLSRLLDEELDMDDGDEPERAVPEDIPVLKSFVDDVPVLSERIEPDKPSAPEQKSDSVDQSVAGYSNLPNARQNGRIDDSWLDKDPLEISAAVRQHKQQPASESAAAAQPEPPVLTVEPVSHAAQPVSKPAPNPTESKPAAKASAYQPPKATPSASGPDTSSVTQPLNRFQTGNKSENPFLPRSTLEKIRENHANDASAELRKLIENNPLQKLSFDLAPNSREFQHLRQKASQMVNEVIRANMPRLEAELRLKLEQEVDRMFKELKKK